MFLALPLAAGCASTGAGSESSGTVAEFRERLTELEGFEFDVAGLKCQIKTTTFSLNGTEAGVAEGTLWYAAPGRVRIDYVDPTPFTVLFANGSGWVLRDSTWIRTDYPYHVGFLLYVDVRHRDDTWSERAAALGMDLSIATWSERGRELGDTVSLGRYDSTNIYFVLTADPSSHFGFADVRSKDGLTVSIDMRSDSKSYPTRFRYYTSSGFGDSRTETVFMTEDLSNVEVLGSIDANLFSKIAVENALLERSSTAEVAPASEG